MLSLQSRVIPLLLLLSRRLLLRLALRSWFRSSSTRARLSRSTLPTVLTARESNSCIATDTKAAHPAAFFRSPRQRCFGGNPRGLGSVPPRVATLAETRGHPPSTHSLPGDGPPPSSSEKLLGRCRIHRLCRRRPAGAGGRGTTFADAHSVPSHNLPRHRCAITCILRAPPSPRGRGGPRPRPPGHQASDISLPARHHPLATKVSGVPVTRPVPSDFRTIDRPLFNEPSNPSDKALRVQQRATERPVL